MALHKFCIALLLFLESFNFSCSPEIVQPHVTVIYDLKCPVSQYIHEFLRNKDAELEKVKKFYEQFNFKITFEKSNEQPFQYCRIGCDLKDDVKNYAQKYAHHNKKLAVLIITNCIPNKKSLSQTFYGAHCSNNNIAIVRHSTLVEHSIIHEVPLYYSEIKSF